MLNFKPTPFDEGLKETYKWYLRNHKPRTTDLRIRRQGAGDGAHRLPGEVRTRAFLARPSDSSRFWASVSEELHVVPQISFVGSGLRRFEGRPGGFRRAPRRSLVNVPLGLHRIVPGEILQLLRRSRIDALRIPRPALRSDPLEPCAGATHHLLKERTRR